MGVPPAPTDVPVVKTDAPTSDKLDLLLVVDNSSSMADKQAVLAGSIRTLLGSLVNPPCVDDSGSLVVQPTTPTGSCPASSHRRFKPIKSMHLGVIDSSLGAVGADQCGENDPTRNNDDKSHLLRRSHGASVPTYDGEGFLAWDPAGQLAPPGEADFDVFVGHAIDLVTGADQNGCGYEMPLESAYRFLVDPAPYTTLQKGDGAIPPVEVSGLDLDLLDERAHFLRQSSVVGVVLLTDENDCSMKVGGQSYAVLDAAPFFRSSSTCATDPNDACCYSCGLGAPSGCAAGAACAAPKLTAAEDSVNLKCWEQKRRYGFDALYPTERYINAFTQTKINPLRDDLSADPMGKIDDRPDNPLFAGGRDPRLFVMTGIVGVPWQTLVHDPADPSSGYQTAEELTQSGFWDREVGDPSLYQPPTDPLMIETYEKRPGVGSDAPNGGDRTIDTAAPSDLQYACIFALPTPLVNGNDCKSGSELYNPLCLGNTQIAAKAYPGLRELAVLRGLGDQATVASICAPITDPGQVDTSSKAFGYNNAMASMLGRLESALAP